MPTYRPTCFAPVFEGSSPLVCAGRTFAYSFLLAFLIFLLALTLGSPAILCLIRQTAFRIRHCREGNSRPDIDLGFSLGAWLDACVPVRDAIVWHRPDGSRHPFSAWSSAERQELARTYDRLVAERDAGLSATPEVTLYLRSDGTVYAEGLAVDLAWRTFLAYVAQPLAAEIRRWVPWSLEELDGDQLEDLFDSRSLFLFERSRSLYAIYQHNSTWSHGSVTPGDPGRAFAFLEREIGLAGGRLETIIQLVDWCRRLSHYASLVIDGVPDFVPASPEGLEAHWQFRGFAPVERMISGTERRGAFNTELRHWTAGCWGTTGFLRAVLRTAGIPVRLEVRCLHALPGFPLEGRFLSHGDDPYSLYAESEPRFPAAELLIDEALLEEWFGPGGSCDNVGRGVAEAARRHLPYALLTLHCQDLAASRTHAASEVFEYLGRYFSLAELEAEGFWSRLDDRVAALGGCASVPPR